MTRILATETHHAVPAFTLEDLRDTLTSLLDHGWNPDAPISGRLGKHGELMGVTVHVVGGDAA